MRRVDGSLIGRGIMRYGKKWDIGQNAEEYLLIWVKHVEGVDKRGVVKMMS